MSQMSMEKTPQNSTAQSHVAPMLPPLSELKQSYQELNYLCMNYDPYQETVDPKTEELLQKFNLKLEKDPFMVTNKLLRMLDLYEAKMKAILPEKEQINTLKH